QVSTCPVSLYLPTYQSPRDFPSHQAAKDDPFPGPERRGGGGIMAVFTCTGCGKTVIAEARPGERKPCPFCGAAVRPAAAPAFAPGPLPPVAAAPAVAEEDRPEVLEARPRRKKRKKRDKVSAPADSGRGSGILGYLVGLLIAVLVGAGLAIVAFVVDPSAGL